MIAMTTPFIDLLTFHFRESSFLIQFAIYTYPGLEELNTGATEITLNKQSDPPFQNASHKEDSLDTNQPTQYQTSL